MSAKMILVVMFFLKALTLTSLNAAEVQGKVLTYGLVKRTTEEVVVKTPETTSGATRIPSGFPAITPQTNRIPAKAGVAFGMVYEISGLTAKDGEEVEIVKVVTHPPMTKPDGSVSKGFIFLEKVPVKAGRAWAFTGYSLDHNYELVTGDWTFEMRYARKPVVKQTFSLYRE